MILQMTKAEYAVFQTLIIDGLDDDEILSQMVSMFSLQPRLIDDISLKARYITGGIAA